MSAAVPFGRGVPGNSWDLVDGVVAAEAPLVSVVVVHFEQPAALARTLRALARQTYGSFEVIVVDDGSATPPLVPDGVRLIRLPDRGFRAAAARNAGAAAARGDVLCFLDADTAPEPGYLAALTRLPAVCPEAVTVGRRRHAAFDASADASATAAAATTDAPVELAGPLAELTEPQWLRDAYASSRDLLDADHRSYRFVISAVLACSRWFFEVTGGFDERFDRYGGEDWEWAHRAYTLGAVFAHVPQAVAWHDGPDLADRVTDRAELLRRKNAETLVLFNRIGVPPTRGDGAAGRGARSAAPDVVVELPGGSAAATLICADVLLSALPSATLVVDSRHAELFEGDARVLPRDRPGDARASAATSAARVIVYCDALFTVSRSEREHLANTLADATERLGVATLGWVDLSSPAGHVHLRLNSARARHRSERWPHDHGFTTEPAVVDLRPLPDEPDLEAHLFGWADL